MSHCVYTVHNIFYSTNKKQRKSTVRQLCTQYVDGIYSNSVTLTSRLGVTKCHWK